MNCNVKIYLKVFCKSKYKLHIKIEMSIIYNKKTN